MKVTTKGQVTIPQDLRRKYQLDSSSEVVSDSPIRNLLGRGDVQLSTEEIMRMTRAD